MVFSVYLCLDCLYVISPCCFSSIGSYYRSPYLDSSSATSSYSNNYSTPDYESKYEALISRNPDGAGKSRSGNVEGVRSSRVPQF